MTRIEVVAEKILASNLTPEEAKAALEELFNPPPSLARFQNGRRVTIDPTLIGYDAPDPNRSDVIDALVTKHFGPGFGQEAARRFQEVQQ